MRRKAAFRQSIKNMSGCLLKKYWIVELAAFGKPIWNIKVLLPHRFFVNHDQSEFGINITSRDSGIRRIFNMLHQFELHRIGQIIHNYPSSIIQFCFNEILLNRDRLTEAIIILIIATLARLIKKKQYITLTCPVVSQLSNW